MLKMLTDVHLYYRGASGNGYLKVYNAATYKDILNTEGRIEDRKFNFLYKLIENITSGGKTVDILCYDTTKNTYYTLHDVEKYSKTGSSRYFDSPLIAEESLLVLDETSLQSSEWYKLMCNMFYNRETNEMEFKVSDPKYMLNKKIQQLDFAHRLIKYITDFDNDGVLALTTERVDNNSIIMNFMLSYEEMFDLVKTDLEIHKSTDDNFSKNMVNKFKLKLTYEEDTNITFVKIL